MFQLFARGGRRNESAVAAEDARKKRIAALAKRLVDLDLVPRDPTTGRMSLHDAARMVIIAHVYNPEIRHALYRGCISSQLGELDALTDSRADVRAMSTREGAVQLDADFWVEFFEHVRLRRWNIRELDRLVVVERSTHALEPNAAPLPTEHFVEFLQQLRTLLIGTHHGRFRDPETVLTNIYHDAVLLYVVGTLLVMKNADEVLAHPHFNYLDDTRTRPLTPYERRYRPPGVRTEDEMDARQVVLDWLTMREASSRIGDVRVDATDYERRIRPVQESLASLLHPSMLQFDFECDHVITASTPATTATTPAATVPREEAVVTAPPPPPPPREEEEAAEATPAAAAAPEAAAEEEAPAEGAEAEISSEAPCAYHCTLREHTQRTLCPRACVTARVGAALYEDDRRALDCARVLYAIGANTARRDALLAEYCRTAPPSKLAHASATPVRGITEWGELMARSFAPSRGTADKPRIGSAMRTPTRVDLGAVDEFARSAGWSALPPHERLARYTTLYALGPSSAIVSWSQRGAAVSAEAARATHTWRTTHSVVPPRTLQTIAHWIMTAEPY